MFFSVITKNSNWKFLIKNLVTSKRKDEIKDEKLLGVHWKIQSLGGESQKTIYWGVMPKCTIMLD